MQKDISRHVIFQIIIVAFFFAGCSTSNKVAQKTEVKSLPIGKELTSDEQMNFERLFIDGLKQKTVGYPDSARFYFLVCLDINPYSAAAMYELANIYIAKGDFISARNHLEDAVEINTENKWYKLLLAQIYQKNQEFEKASDVYHKLTELEPTNIQHYYVNALLLSEAKKYDQAITVYNQIEEQFGYNDQLALARQQIFRIIGDNKKAYKEVEQLIKYNPLKGEYYGVMADMYKDDGDMQKALENYTKVLELDPENGFIHFSLAMYYAQNNEFEKVYEHAYLGIGNADVEIETKIQLYLMLTTSPDKFKLDDKQIEELIQLIAKVHPDDPRSSSIYADFLIQRDKKQEAREYLYNALELDGDSYPMWEQLVLIDNELNDYENMVIDSDNAIKYFPTQPLLYVLNAVGNLQQKNYSRALKALETGQPYANNNAKLEAQFEMYRAEAYYNLDNKSEAFSSFDKVIQIEPGNFLAMNNYAYYLSVSGEQLDKAEMMSSRVIQAHPDNPTYLDTHAWVLFKRGEYRLAKHYMETAMKNGGDENPVVVEHYGDILFHLKDVNGALKNWQLSIDAGNESEVLKQKVAEKRYIKEVE